MGVGDVSCPYIGPGPPYSTGKHRYVFLLYDQGESKVDTHAAQEAFENRGGCKAHKFAVEQGFTGPLAVSAFESEWEEFVDGVHAAIGFVPPPECVSPRPPRGCSDAGRLLTPASSRLRVLQVPVPRPEGCHRR